MTALLVIWAFGAAAIWIWGIAASWGNGGTDGDYFFLALVLAVALVWWIAIAIAAITWMIFRLRRAGRRNFGGAR